MLDLKISQHGMVNYSLIKTISYRVSIKIYVVHTSILDGILETRFIKKLQFTRHCLALIIYNNIDIDGYNMLNEKHINHMQLQII